MSLYFSHPSAVIDSGASIGRDTSIWHFSHICSGAQIGNNCSIGQNVYIASSAVIGNNVKIQNNVSVYDLVTLHDDVFCGPSVVFTNVINPRSAFSRKTEYRSTIVHSGATLGANATIVCGSSLGSHCFIGAGAVVTSDVKPFSLMLGVPARHAGWVSIFGESVPLPLHGHGSWTCPHTRHTYILSESQLNIIPS